MVDCDFCDEELEGKKDLHIHWLEEHEEELNSHQEEKARKAKKEREEREEIRREKRKKYVFQGVGIAVLLLIGGVLASQLIPSGSTSQINLEGEPMIGSENASVTVVEYGDFQCPACNRFEQNTFSKLKTEYIETGKVKFYWKDRPLDKIHPWARTGAEAMECVYRQDQDAFWKVKSKLFDNQGSLNIGNVEDRVVSWAGEEGVNESKVRSCIESGDARSEVSEDNQEALGSGVRGTPTVFVNGKKLDSFGYSSVSQAIEEELN